MRSCLAVILVALSWAPFSKANAQARIIGGDDAADGAYPWMAALVEKGRTPSRGQFCGGMLVAPQWVLTAAHCVEGENRNTIDVWVGLTNLAATGDGQKRKAQAIIRHPNYRVDRWDNLYYDVALILLDRPVTGITPIALASQASDNDVGELVRALGWGTTDPVFDLFPNQLQQVDLEIVDIADAQADYQNILGATHLAAAALPNYRRDTCSGDSGGPLFRIISGNEVLVGVVSFGDGCAVPDVEGIYANVLFLKPWIDERLAWTAQPPDLMLNYRGRLIQKGDVTPRQFDGTHFGNTRARGRGKTRAFRVRNDGAGILTVGGLRANGSIFRILNEPPVTIGSGGNPKIRIRFTPRRRGNYNSLVRFVSNDPDDPFFWFRIRGRGR